MRPAPPAAKLFVSGAASRAASHRNRRRLGANSLRPCAPDLRTDRKRGAKYLAFELAGVASAEELRQRADEEDRIRQASSCGQCAHNRRVIPTALSAGCSLPSNQADMFGYEPGSLIMDSVGRRRR